VQFNVSSLLQQHTGALREYVIDDDVRIDGERHHLAGQARMDRTPDGIFVRAEMRGTHRTECSRCLRPVEIPVVVAFAEEYLPSVDVVTGARLDPPEGREEAYRINERHFLDLEEPVQQYWAMAVPMAPLCREDCAGLCSACGQEIAGGVHRCTDDEIDARWAKLAELTSRSR